MKVCPAQAGMIRVVSASTQADPGLPRTIGDDPLRRELKTKLKTFAPHTRG